MKHFITTIFLAHFLLTAFAQNTVIIQAPDVQVNAGQEITYPITINPNGNSVVVFNFQIEYDSTLFQPLGVEQPNGWGVVGNGTTPGIIILAGFATQGGENTTFQAVNLIFKAIGQAGQTSQIQLSEGLDEGVVYDSNSQPLDYQFSNGSISINTCNPLDSDCKADILVNCGNVSVSGNTLSVSNIVVTNSGESEASYSFIAFYLLSDADITSPDFYLGYDYVPATGEGSTSDKNTTIDLGNLNIPEGTYYLGILADFTGRVDESDETNNTCYIEVFL